MAENFTDMPDAVQIVDESPDLGGIPVPLGDRLISCGWADSVHTSHIVTSDHPVPVIAIFVMNSEHEVGLYSTMTIAVAREMAAGLLRSAEAAEANYGVTKQ